MQINKEHEGKTIIAVPTGNNAVRGVKKQTPRQVHVVKVKKRYADVRFDNARYEVTLDRKSGATEQAVRNDYGTNAGYRFFNDMAEYEEHQRLWQLKEEILHTFRHFGRPLDNLTAAEIETIHGILVK